MEHAAEVWCSGGHSACRMLESAQMRGWEIVGGEEYSSRSASAGRSRVEKAGGEEGRDESVVW